VVFFVNVKSIVEIVRIALVVEVVGDRVCAEALCIYEQRRWGYEPAVVLVRDRVDA